jgi:hypothetical protein
MINQINVYATVWYLYSLLTYKTPDNIVQINKIYLEIKMIYVCAFYLKFYFCKELSKLKLQLLYYLNVEDVTVLTNNQV